MGSWLFISSHCALPKKTSFLRTHVRELSNVMILENLWITKSLSPLNRTERHREMDGRLPSTHSPELFRSETSCLPVLQPACKGGRGECSSLPPHSLLPPSLILPLEGIPKWILYMPTPCKMPFQDILEKLFSTV